MPPLETCQVIWRRSSCYSLVCTELVIEYSGPVVWSLEVFACLQKVCWRQRHCQAARPELRCSGGWFITGEGNILAVGFWFSVCVFLKVINIAHVTYPILNGTELYFPLPLHVCNPNVISYKLLHYFSNPREWTIPTYQSLKNFWSLFKQHTLSFFLC